MAAELTRRDFARASIATTLGVAAGAAEKSSEASAPADRVSAEARSETVTGADLLVRQLKAQGVAFVATLCGNGLDPFYVACKRHGLRLVDVRNEQAAGYMADAVGRLTGRVGVCSASSGVAHVNALTGLTNAYFDGSPVLLLTGASESRTAGMGNFQDLDHVALARPICKLVQRVDRPERVALAVHEAVAAAQTGRPGPVHLSIASDVLRAPVEAAEVERWLKEAEGRPAAGGAPLGGTPGVSDGRGLGPPTDAPRPSQSLRACHPAAATPPSAADSDLVREAVD